MKEGIEGKIQRVYRQYDTRKVGRAIRHYGPYWFGYYQRDGRHVKVYIGKELPESLKYLIRKRFVKPGYKNYTWPGQKSLTLKKGGIEHGAIKV